MVRVAARLMDIVFFNDKCVPDLVVCVSHSYNIWPPTSHCLCVLQQLVTHMYSYALEGSCIRNLVV